MGMGMVGYECDCCSSFGWFYLLELTDMLSTLAIV